MDNLNIIEVDLDVFPTLGYKINSFPIFKETKQRYYVSPYMYVSKSSLSFTESDSKYYDRVVDEFRQVNIDWARMNILGENVWVPPIACLDDDLKEAIDYFLVRYSLLLTQTVEPIKNKIDAYDIAIANTKQFLK